MQPESNQTLCFFCITDVLPEVLLNKQLGFAQQLVRRSSGGLINKTSDHTLVTLPDNNHQSTEMALLRGSSSGSGDGSVPVRAAHDVSITISRGWISGEMVGLLGEDVEAGMRRTPERSSSQVRPLPMPDSSSSQTRMSPQLGAMAAAGMLTRTSLDTATPEILCEHISNERSQREPPDEHLLRHQ